MNRLFLILAEISGFMVLLVGTSVYLVPNKLIFKSKVDVVDFVAKDISTTLSEQIGFSTVYWTRWRKTPMFLQRLRKITDYYWHRGRKQTGFAYS